MTNYTEMECLRCKEKQVREDTENHTYICDFCGFEEDTLY